MTKKINKHIGVIIPSYNESFNLALLIPRILAAVPTATIIIVDDSLGEESFRTKKVCDRYKKSVICILRRKKSGRGSAVIEGMKVALGVKTISIMVEMDADLAHDPKEIKLLCAPIVDHDVVVGSRYMSGSNIITWTKSRLIQSKLINFFLRFWLGLQLTDYTNGFRAYTRQACQHIVNEKLYEHGFIALSEIAYILTKNGFSITEVPISFTDRKYGKSNANWKELAQSLFGVLRMRFRHI